MSRHKIWSKLLMIALFAILYSFNINNFTQAANVTLNPLASPVKDIRDRYYVDGTYAEYFSDWFAPDPVTNVNNFFAGFNYINTPDQAVLSSAGTRLDFANSVCENAKVASLNIKLDFEFTGATLSGSDNVSFVVSNLTNLSNQVLAINSTAPVNPQTHPNIAADGLADNLPSGTHPLSLEYSLANPSDYLFSQVDNQIDLNTLALFLEYGNDTNKSVSLKSSNVALVLDDSPCTSTTSTNNTNGSTNQASIPQTGETRLNLLFAILTLATFISLPHFIRSKK